MGRYTRRCTRVLHGVRRNRVRMETIDRATTLFVETGNGLRVFGAVGIDTLSSNGNLSIFSIASFARVAGIHDQWIVLTRR